MEIGPLKGIISFDINIKNKNYVTNEKIKLSLTEIGSNASYFNKIISKIQGGEIYFPGNTSLFSFKMDNGDLFAISEINDDVISAYVFWISGSSPKQLIIESIKEIEKRNKQNNSSSKLKANLSKKTKLTLIETSFLENINYIEEAKHHFVVLQKNRPKLPIKFYIELFLSVVGLIIFLGFDTTESFRYFILGTIVPLFINTVSDLIQLTRKEYSFELDPITAPPSVSSIHTADEETSASLQDPSSNLNP